MTTGLPTPSSHTRTPPISRERVVDLYFMEHRGKLLDLAAFLDRVDRAAAEGSASDDPRMPALRAALAIMSDGKPERARRVLELWSDSTGEPIASATGKSAIGVAPGGAYDGKA